MWKSNFRAAWCERLNKSPADFERMVFLQSLYPHARFIAAIAPGYFEIDRAAVRQLGEATSRQEFMSEIDDMRIRHRERDGSLRRLLRLRISGHRLLQILAEVSPERASSQKSAITDEPAAPDRADVA
jgi:hypothetical protein